MVVERLGRGDRRSIGRSDEVAAEIAADQALFDEVFRALFFDDPVIRMRAADAVEKASRQCPQRLHPHKDALLNALPAVDQQEVRWHLLQMLPRLELNPSEKKRALAVAMACLRDKSTIVRVNALEALTQLAGGSAELQAEACRILAHVLETGTPAEKARARKLLRTPKEARAPERSGG